MNEPRKRVAEAKKTQGQMKEQLVTKLKSEWISEITH